MMYWFLFGGLFLSWSFGRNNLSNVFGTAIGTRMVYFRLAASLAGVFILLGALFSSTQTTDAMLQIAHIPSVFGAFLISVSVALTILFVGHFGIPVSMAQSSIGALIGWNIFFQMQNNWPVGIDMVGAWFYCPVVAAVFAMLGFYAAKALLQYVKIPILYRDMWLRILLILSGVYSAYFLGANNMPAIAGPYLAVENVSAFYIILFFGFVIAVGALMADKRVIAMVSSGLYPLSPVEALVVVWACGLTLYCFSGNGLWSLLLWLHLPAFPLVPIPTSSVLVGSIIGVGFVKGSAGIRWHSFSKVIASWFVVPIISGLICWGILTILTKGGTIL